MSQQEYEAGEQAGVAKPAIQQLHPIGERKDNAK
jgi:hypothetical protein